MDTPPLDPKPGADDVRVEEAPASPAKPRRKRKRRWGRGILVALFFVGIVVGVSGAALVKSRPGQRLVLDAALGQVRGLLAGPLTVEAIHSSSLLGGATLVGVTLEAEGGRRFLDADSVRVRYSLLSLFGPVPRIRSVTLYGPAVEISRYPDEEVMNVARLMAPRSPQPGDTLAGRGLSLGAVRVVGGLLEVLTPLEGEPPPRTPTVPSPNGQGTLRRLALDSLELELGEVRIGGDGGDALTALLHDFSTTIHLLDEPLRLAHAEGTITFGEEGLRLEEGTFLFPGSAFDGTLAMGPGEGEGWGFRIALDTQGPAALSDLAWLDARLPEGVFRGGVDVSVAEALDVELRDVRVELEASRLTLDGGVRVVDGRPTLRELEVQASPLVLARLEPWLQGDMPLDGWLSGNLRLSGRPASLSATGRVTLVPSGYGGAPTTADLRGVFHFGADPGFTNLRATVDPLNLALVRVFQPQLDLQGPASARVEVSGRVDEGLRFVADLGHGEDGADASRVLIRGSARRGGGAAGSGPAAWVMDVQGDLSPLAMDLLHQVAPGLASVGGVHGSVRAVGPLTALRLSGDLQVAEGRVSVTGEVDAARPGQGYRLDATVEDVRISRVTSALPDPSRWTGHLKVEGRGLTLDSLDAAGTVLAVRSRLGGLHVDSLTGSVAVRGGVLTVDTVSGIVGGLTLEGAGAVGLVEGAHGDARLSFRTDDLVGLRPLLMGDSVMAKDTLSVLERQLLRLQGVDADTLPLLADVMMSGALEGVVDLTGTLSELGVSGTVRIRNGALGEERVGDATIQVTALDVTGAERRVDLEVDARDVVAFDRSITELVADVSLEGRAGAGSVSALQTSGDRYQVMGDFALDSAGGGGVVRLEEASVDVDSLAWHLLHPAEVRWDSASVFLDNLEVTREGEDPMLVRANGILAWNGESDLRVEADGLHVDRVARILQREDLAIGGHVQLTAQITGPAADPLIQGDFHVEEPRYGEMALGVLVGEWRYEDQEARISMGALDQGRRVFRAGGSIPVDLALRPQGRRVLPRPMDVRVEADSLDASLMLSPLSFLEDVEGVVSGDFTIRGTLDAPEPSGVLRLSDGTWTMEALGVRHSGVSGSLTLNPDRTVDVVVDGRAGGTSQVRGQVILDPVTDPRLRLTVSFNGFEAVNRRDLAGLMSGEVRLLGSYTAPRVEGDLSVDRGTLFLEEFARSTEIVDLTDPRIFREVVDTTALSTRPLLAGIRNPFMENLRVDVNLSVPRDTWLRSEEMNVEIGGSLFMRYDRLNRDVVMVGELEALRGSYSVLGRRFDVEGGTVGFMGTPGINPTLDIQAVTRIRRREDALEVNASVQGTLTQPRVTLSSEEQGVAESDLVSYLIFGRPSYELATGEEAWLGGAAGSFVGAAQGAGLTYLTGTLATRLGAALNQQIGLDYLSITQEGDYGLASGTLSDFSGTQVEVGQYLGEDVFVVFIFRPLSRQNPNQGFFGGARVEGTLTDELNIQGFWEDRFLRSRVGGFGDLGVQASQVVGVFIFREWGY